MKTVNDNLLFIADTSLIIVAFNRAAKEAFPSMEIGRKCPEATNLISDINKNPDNIESTSTTAFLMDLCRWISISISKMEYGDHGECFFFTGTFFNTLNRELMSRANLMNNFTFALNMNLTQDKYVLLSEERFGKKFQFPEEPLSKLLERTCTTMVHPDDQQKFMDFMNLETMSQRLKEAKEPVTAVIKEKNFRGNWDDVTIYLVSEEKRADGQELVIAFMYVNLISADKLTKTTLDKDKLTGLFTRQSFRQAANECFFAIGIPNYFQQNSNKYANGIPWNFHLHIA